METLSSIEKMIAAAQALGAPLFGLDLLRNGAAAVAAKKAIEEIKDDGSDIYHMAGKSETPELDADDQTIMIAARSAFAFAACRHLPEELGEYREREDANDLILAGYKVAKRYTGS